MGKKNKGGRVVYSTNPDFEQYEDEEQEETLSPGEQTLYVSLDRKQRKGKEVTLVEGFVGTEDDLKELGKMLKNKCGTGGSVKDGEILVQGDHRTKVKDLLQQEGYKVKLKG